MTTSEIGIPLNLKVLCLSLCVCVYLFVSHSIQGMERIRNHMGRLLVLHFDVNRTIIQTDEAGGKTLDQVLASNVGAKVMGRVVDGKFEIISGPDSCKKTAEAAGYISHGTFIDDTVHPTPGDLHTKPPSERRAIMKEVRALRQPRYYAFVAPEGQGAEYGWAMEKQRVALTAPPALHVEGRTTFKGDGLWHIIPGFFHLINTLSVAGYPFVLCFRTFGSDLPVILEEWKQFVLGQHLMQPEGPILAAMKAAWVDPPVGSLYRDEHECCITWGTSSAPPPPPDGIQGGLKYLHSLPNYKTATLVRPDHTLLMEIVNRAAAAHNVCGLVDYYPYWSSHGERKHAGKLCPTSYGAGEDAPPMDHVFFDDNIYLFDANDESIVDFRGWSGEALGDDIAQRYAAKVEPYDAIADPDYFIKLLCESLAAQ